MSHHNKGEMRLGGGGRFRKLKAEIAAKGGVSDPGAVAAAIGRKKYGKSKFQKLAAAGRKAHNVAGSPLKQGIGSHVEYVK